MRGLGFLLKGGCVFLLALFFCAVVYATSTALTKPHVLREVRVVSQSGRLHVLLIGSPSMTYKATKTSSPPGVMIDLPNTVSKPLIASPVGYNEIIDTVKSSTIIHGPSPLTRVEIVLRQDISYDINQEQDKIRIDFNRVLPISQTEGVETELPAEVKADAPTIDTKESSAAITSQPAPEEPQRVAEQILPSASKILDIEAVEMGENIDVHIIGDGRFDRYDMFLLIDPPRLAVDLLGVKSIGRKDELILSGPWAKRLRVGRHAEKVRVVFDLRFTPKGELPFQVTVEENRLVVSLLPGYSLPPQ